MTGNKSENPEKKQNNENFDLEEIVLNTNQAKNWDIHNNPEMTDAEIVKKMQQTTPPPNTTPKENLDTVIMAEKPANGKSGTSNTRENKIKKEKENKTKNTETIDDILVEEEKKSNRSRILAIIIILLLIWGLIRLLKQDKKDNNTTDVDLSWTTTTWEATKTWEISHKNNKKLTSLWGDYYYNAKENTIYYKKLAIKNTDRKSFKVLAKGYAKDKNWVYYKGILIPNLETDKFKVIKENGSHRLTGLIVTSKNLLEYLKIKKNRIFLMTTIASITNKNQNVKDELTQSSVYAMDWFKSDFNELNTLQRWDDMTDLQRAKFGVIFLYIKIIKSLETDQIRMSKAKKELQYFINHSDEILKTYGPEQNKKDTLQWDIGYDQYCVYKDWELFACFLNEIFINKD